MKTGNGIRQLQTMKNCFISYFILGNNRDRPLDVGMPDMYLSTIIC